MTGTISAGATTVVIGGQKGFRQAFADDFARRARSSVFA